MSERSSHLYLDDIKIAIKKIEKYTAEFSEEEFINDEKTVDAVIRNLGIIGEAASNLPVPIKDENLKIPWREIIGMRNKVIHEYFGVDWDVLWETVKYDIPELKKQIKNIKL